MPWWKSTKADDKYDDEELEEDGDDNDEYDDFVSCELFPFLVFTFAVEYFGWSLEMYIA